MARSPHAGALIMALASGLTWSKGALGANPAMPGLSSSLFSFANDPTIPLTRYNKDISGGAYTNGAWNGGWQVALAVAAWQGDTAADARLLQQINYNLQGANTICANGGYPAQHELLMTSTYAILRQSDRFWNNVLNASQRSKIDLIMKAALIGSAYTTADATPSAGLTTLDGDTNVGKGWNMNYQQGMFGNLIAGEVYFGGASQVNTVLNAYNHAAFVTDLQNAGLTNLVTTFTWKQTHPTSGAPSGTTIEKNIRNYKYNGQPLMDPFGQYARLATDTYSKIVSAGLNNGAGILYNGVATGVIAAGAADLPNKGALGMLQEFDTMDANGKRSSASYCYYDFRPDLVNQLTVLIGGYWQAGTTADTILARENIGITDLRYKLDQGYKDYAKGVGHTTPTTFNDPNMRISYNTVFPLWTDVVRPYFFPTISAVTGNLQITAARVRQQTLTIADAATTTGAKLTIAESAPGISSGVPSGNDNNVSVVQQLNINPLGTLDLTNNDLIIDYSANPASSPLAAIEAMVRSGYNSGTWTGKGITSSIAASNIGSYALVVLDNAKRPTPFTSFDGIVVPTSVVIVKFSWIADLDLDGLVTSNDAIVFANNYSEGASATHRVGDLNYNGIFDSNDAILFTNAYNETLPHLPEPASILLLAAGVPLLVCRRRA